MGVRFETFRYWLAKKCLSIWLTQCLLTVKVVKSDIN